VKFYRHLGLLNGWIKIFVIFCAGFGFEWFFSVLTKKRISHLRKLCCLLLLLITVDLFIFQKAIIQTLPKLSIDQYEWLSSVYVSKPVFQPERSYQPVTERQRRAQNLIDEIDPTGREIHDFNFIQMDHCNPAHKRNWMGTILLEKRGILTRMVKKKSNKKSTLQRFNITLIKFEQ